MIVFNKPAIDLQQQLKKCEQNGLVIDDRDDFIANLKTIGYYRLKGYLLPFTERKQSLTSSQLLAIYDFDRKLRLLFLNAIEKIEIALKAIVNDYMSLTYDPFWFNNPKIIDKDIIDLIANHYGTMDRSHKIIAHYYSKYESPPYPPSWVIMEVIGMSDISKIISKLHNRDLKPLAQFFDHSPRVIKSWIRSLTITRNICAHHGRLWDRAYKISPERTKELAESILKNSLAEQVIITDYLTKKISPEMDFCQQVMSLISNYEDIIIQEKIGFTGLIAERHDHVKLK
ncbi:MAG: Abi family protein [Alphaproteobacteria bacterium]